MNINLTKEIREQVIKEIADCDTYRRDKDPGCKKCIMACPAGKDPEITIDELNQSTLGKIDPSEKIYNYAFSCMQTAKCSLACPVELKRDLMMLQLKSILPKPKVIKKYNRLRGTETGLIGGTLQHIFEWNNKKNMGGVAKYLGKELEEAETLFYFGCYLNTPKICNNTLLLAEKFGEKDFEVLGGLKTCCGYPQYLQGDFQLAETYLENLYRDIKKVNPKKVITSCMECYGALHILSEKTDLTFSPTTTTKWITENKEKLDFSTIEKEDVIFHDSCLRCHKRGECSAPRQLLREFSEVDEFDKNKQNSLCCTYYAFNFNPKNRKDLHEIKKGEIDRKGHHTMITECITCDDAFNKSFGSEKFKVKNLVDYLAERITDTRTKKEKFDVQIDTSAEQFECLVCNWIYDESKGDPDGGIAPGTKFEDIPDSWRCPVCGVTKDQFKKIVRKEGGGSSYFGDLERSSDEIEPEMAAIFQKSVTGKSEISAMRTPKQKNLFENILFNPGQLARKPLREDEVEVNFKTIIGPNARKPLEINLPYFVSHMSFGALSKEAKTALAIGAHNTCTAMCSGEGGMLPEEKDAACKYIFEYSTGRFGATEEIMKQSDAIEIKIGQAAKAGMGGHLLGDKVTEEIAKVRNVEPHKTVISPANHPDINSKEDLKKKTSWLREVTEGIPIGIKIAAGDIEADMEVALFVEPDFITIDCRGGATGAAPTHVKDNVCIPPPYAVYRARKFLDEKGRKDITLILAGGLRTSADITKCLAMGADAIGLATIAMIGIGCQQYRVCHKGTCPVGIATQDPKLRAKFDVDKSAQMLTNLFNVYQHEMADFVRIIGKKDIHDLSPEDLVTLDSEISEFTNVRHA